MACHFMACQLMLCQFMACLPVLQTFLDRKLIFTQAGKKTAIRRIAVRETSVSRYHGGPFKGPLKPSGISYHYRIEEFKEAHKS